MFFGRAQTNLTSIYRCIATVHLRAIITILMQIAAARTNLENNVAASASIIKRKSLQD
jgi:hypothetical protein